MKIAHKFLIAGLASLSFMSIAQAQSNKPVVTDGKGIQPYVLNSDMVVVRSGAGLCWRTGTWTKADALAAKVIGSEFPVGCFCEPDYMANEAVCKPAPAPVAAAPIAPPPAPAPAPAPVVAPSPAVVPAAEKVTLAADTLFDFDKAVLRPAGVLAIDDFIMKLKDINPEVIIAVGHADRFGSDDYNQTLSERRVESVRSYMMSKGIASNRILAEGKGETQPLTKPGECEGRKSVKVIACLQQDRRVEIEVVGTRNAQ